MKTPTVVLPLLLISVSTALAESGGGPSRRRRRGPQEEEDKERYQKPFTIIVTAIFLSVAPALARFAQCVATDPVVPLLWKELKIRGKRIINQRFGNLGDSRFNDQESNKNRRSETK